MICERPVLFSAPMVRAILDGRKTQTRRIVKGAPVHCFPMLGRDSQPDGTFFVSRTDSDCVGSCGVLCPYGQPGDRLWVRETAHVTNAGDVIYRADYSANAHARGLDNIPIEADVRWKPSIFMRRHESRITLEVTGVRVERLQEISEADAKSEGMDLATLDGIGGDQPIASDLLRRTKSTHPYTLALAILWDTINAERALWVTNPWVWVVEFKRVEQKAVAA